MHHAGATHDADLGRVKDTRRGPFLDSFLIVQLPLGADETCHHEYNAAIVEPLQLEVCNGCVELADDVVFSVDMFRTGDESLGRALVSRLEVDNAVGARDPDSVVDLVVVAKLARGYAIAGEVCHADLFARLAVVKVVRGKGVQGKGAVVVWDGDAAARGAEESLCVQFLYLDHDDDDASTVGDWGARQLAQRGW